MNNLVNLQPTTVAPDEATITILKHALTQAQEGKLRDVSVCGNMVGGDVYYAYSSKDTMLLVAQLAKMQHMVLTNSYDTGPSDAKNT